MKSHRIDVTLNLTPLYGSTVSPAAIDRAIAAINRLIVADGVFEMTVASFTTDVPAEVS